MDNLLYHAISYEHLHTALKHNRLVGGSTHRLHRNGTLPWPLPGGKPTPQYLQSQWYFGICLTRDPRFAWTWGDVVLTLDKERLRQRHKLVPYNWMETRVKAEAEEFLLTWGPLCTVEQERPTTDAEGNFNPFKRILVEETRGEVRNLSRYLRKIEVWPLGHPDKQRRQLRFKDQEAERSHNRYLVKKFEGNRPWLQEYCDQHALPLEVHYAPEASEELLLEAA